MYYGKYGGQFVPEIMIPVLTEFEYAYNLYKEDPKFKKELDFYLKNFAGRATPLYFAKNLSKKCGIKIYLKREDLLHSGSHKLNNTLGQALLAKYMGKKRIITGTGDGQHGVASSMSGTVFGLETEIYMGSKDVERQKMNVYRMELIGSKVHSVTSGSGGLKDAIDKAFNNWITNIKNTHYLIGSVVGSHPFPMIVRDFQSIIGKETKEQIMEKEGRYPDSIVACVGGGSNAIGIFYPFIKENVKLIAVEAGGIELKSDQTHAFHSASLLCGTEGVLHGAKTRILQNTHGQILNTHSISAGLDYPGVGPELAYLAEKGRLTLRSVNDKGAINAFHKLSRAEGIIPALESSHAISFVLDNADELGELVVINLSGRGDKDLETMIQKM